MKLVQLLVLWSLLLLPVVPLLKEEDILCKNRDSPYTKILDVNATTTDSLNSIAYLKKSEEILLWGTYQSTKGMIAGTNKNGNLNWFYSIHEPCAYIYTDDKESSVNAILWSSGNTLEIHSYNAENTLDRFYMYELNQTDIIAVNDATVNSDFNWVLATLSDSSWLMIMITKIRRKVYQCSNNVVFQSLRFVNSDPVVIGNDNSGTIYFSRFLSDRFEFQWQKQVSGFTSTDMTIYNSYDSNDKSDVLCAFSLNSTDYLMMLEFDYDNGKVKKNKVFKYAMTGVRINYSSNQQDYVVSGYISSTNQNVFVRYDGDFYNLRLIKASNQANYNILPLSITLDGNNNILMGGQYTQNRLLLYKTGEELSAYSCVFEDSTKTNEYTIEKSSMSISETTSSLTMTSISGADWKNQTGRIFTYTTGLSMSSVWSPPLNSHWIKDKYVVNRYEIVFDELCTDNLNITMSVTKKSNDVTQANPKLMVQSDQGESSDSKNIHIVTTDLNPGIYEVSLEARLSNQSVSGYIDMTFEYEVERSLFMIAISVLYYTMLALIIIDAFVSKKFVLLWNFIYASQFIHLWAMTEVYAPPSSVYFGQNIVVSTFMHPIFVRFLMDEPSEAHGANYYNVGFENIFSNLPVLVFALLTAITLFLLILTSKTHFTQLKKHK